MDGGLVGKVAAELMDSLEESVARGEYPEDAELLEVAVVVIVNSDELGATRARAKFSSELRYRQVGIMHEGMECAEGDFSPSDEELD